LQWAVSEDPSVRRSSSGQGSGGLMRRFESRRETARLFTGVRRRHRLTVADAIGESTDRTCRSTPDFQLGMSLPMPYRRQRRAAEELIPPFTSTAGLSIARPFVHAGSAASGPRKWSRLCIDASNISATSAVAMIAFV